MFSILTRRPSAFIEKASIWKRSRKCIQITAYISFQCGQLKTHRSKTRASAPKALNFSRSSHRRIGAEDHNGQKDFGCDLVEQAHGGTSLSLSSIRIPFNYVTSYHSAFWIVLVWTVENATKTVVCTRIDECVRDYTENEFFWKRISVDESKSPEKWAN